MTKEIFVKSVTKLLLSMFSADDFRRFVRYSPNGTDLVELLNGATASPALIVEEGVVMLMKNDAINEGFFDRLIDERPRRKSEIDQLRMQWRML